MKLINICLFLFLLCTAMTCDDDYLHPVNLADFSVSHIDNGGEKPFEVLQGEQINRNAYVLKLKLNFSDNTEEVFSPDYACRLKDPIVRIRIISFTENGEEQEVQADFTEFFKCYQVIDKKKNYDIIPLPMNNIDTLVNSNLYLALINSQSSGEYRFQVYVTLQSGLERIHMTEPIYLF